MNFLYKSNWKINIIAILIAGVIFFTEQSNSKFFICDEDGFCKMYTKSKEGNVENIKVFSLRDATCSCQRFPYRLTRNSSKYQLLLKTKHEDISIKEYYNFTDCYRDSIDFINVLKTNKEISSNSAFRYMLD